MTLSKAEIARRLSPKAAHNEDRIVVTPLIDTKEQLGRVEIDLRLGSQFYYFQRTLSGISQPFKAKRF